MGASPPPNQDSLDGLTFLGTREGQLVWTRSHASSPPNQDTLDGLTFPDTWEG